MSNYIKKWFCKYLKKWFCNQRPTVRNVDYLVKQPHGCSLVALARVIDSLGDDQIIESFMVCCDRWPHAGVNNREFSVVLEYLNLSQRFYYDDSVNQTIGSLRRQNENTFIALINGHFTVVKNGEVINQPYGEISSYHLRVYYSWKLL